MEIGKFNQMKAYLLKPKRLFTNKQNTIGGGNFTGQDLGSRTGFSGIQQVKNVKKMQLAFPNANVEEGDYFYKIRNTDYKGPGKGDSPLKIVGPFKNKKTAQASFDERAAKVAEIKKATLESGMADHAKKINKFVTDFYEQNIDKSDKYGIRDYEEFKKDFLKAYKESGIKDIGRRSATTFGDFPNVGKFLTEKKRKGTQEPLEMYGMKARVPSGKNLVTDSEAFFKKAFFSAQIAKNPKLQRDLKRYIDYYNIDKKFYLDNPNQIDREALKKQYADVLNPDVNPDLIFLLESDSVGTGKIRGAIMRNFFSEDYQNYVDKKNRSNIRYKELMNRIENDLTPKQLEQALGKGQTSIKNFMDKQTAALNKIFNTGELKKAGYPELIFNADHLEGIAEIANMTNSEEKVRALKNLVGMTAQRNYQLGFGGYSQLRRSLVDKIQKGIDVKKNVAELNKVTKIAYPEFEGDLYRYNPATKSVIPTENFRFEYEPEVAFKQYFSELATNPTGKFKGTEALIKAGAGSPELVKFIQDIEGGNFKNFNKVVSAYQKGKVEFGKELDYYCKLAGKRKLATGIVPGATCSSADIERGMRTDAKTPEGRERLTKVAKNFGKIFGKIVAPIDIGIEGAFALPHLLRGDAEGAIAATTAGLFGAGKDAMEQVGERFGTDSPEYALYGAENAIQQKMTAIAGLDKLLMQNRQLGIIPEESGEFKKGIGRQPQEDALRKQFAEQFVTLSKLDKGATEDFAQYYPLTADLTQRNKAIQNVRGLSDEIQSSGLLKNIKGPSDTKTIEGFLETDGGRSKFPILPRFDIPALRAQATDYTGMDYLDRYSDLPITEERGNIAAQVPAFEKAQLGPGIKRYAMEFGPKAAKEFFDAQGIDTQPYLEGMAPLLYKANGGRIGFKKGFGIFKGLPGIQLGRIEKELIKKYRREDAERSLLDIIKQSNEEANQIVNKRKLDYINDLMEDTNILDEKYVNLIDEEIRINDPELFKTIKQFEANERPALADKMRALRHPDWAEANYGEDYMSALEQGQVREINKMMDDLPDVQERTLVDDIDDMNKANIDEIMGRKKNAIGGRITFASGGRMSYAEGPEDPSKRKFLKNVGIGGGIAGGFMTGLLNLVDLLKGGQKGVVATKAAESEAEKIFFDLVDVVKNKGILKRLDDPSEIKIGEIYEYKGVKVLEDGENIEVRFTTDKGAPAVVEYRKPGYEVDPDAGTSQQVPGEFIYEAQETARYGPDGDVEMDFVEEVIDPIENIKDMAKEKK
jgi:hypothetical protein